MESILKNEFFIYPKIPDNFQYIDSYNIDKRDIDRTLGLYLLESDNIFINLASFINKYGKDEDVLLDKICRVIHHEYIHKVIRVPYDYNTILCPSRKEEEIVREIAGV